MATEEAVASIETVDEVVTMVDDREEEIKEAEDVAAVEITFLKEMEIGHVVDVQIKISLGEMNVIGKSNAIVKLFVYMPLLPET